MLPLSQGEKEGPARVAIAAWQVTTTTQPVPVAKMEKRISSGGDGACGAREKKHKSCKAYSPDGVENDAGGVNAQECKF